MYNNGILLDVPLYFFQIYGCQLRMDGVSFTSNE